MMIISANQPDSKPVWFDLDVLVVGAGPARLTVGIVDPNTTGSTFSKTLVADARTLEVFDIMGVTLPGGGRRGIFPEMALVAPDGYVAVASESVDEICSWLRQMDFISLSCAKGR